jgi:DNA mismatch endonuclease, patch repair protein
MSAVRSKGNRSTEWRLRPYLVQAGLRGWKVQANDLPGKPDFIFLKERLAIFVDGCFWHGCPICYRMPHSNKRYWQNKIKNNKTRDKKNIKKLHELNWKVIRLWEHQLKKCPIVCIEIILSNLDRPKYNRKAIKRGKIKCLL